MMNKKRIPKSAKRLFGVVQQVLQKSLKRSRTFSEDILLQISARDYLGQSDSYEAFLRELEYHKDQITKKKD